MLWLDSLVSNRLPLW